MQNVWGKSEGRIGKLAINLHRIEAVFQGQLPSPLIERHTIKAAIALTYFSAQQVQAIYAMLGGENSLSPMLAKVLDIAERKGDWIKASDVYLNITKSKRPKGETVRQWFRELVALNQGEIRGQNRSLEFRFHPKLDKLDTSLDDLSNALTPKGKGIQEKLDKLDKLDDFAEKLNSAAAGDKAPKSSLEREKIPITSKTSNLSNNSQDAVVEPDLALDDQSNLESNLSNTAPNNPQYPQTDHKIPIGSTVKVHEADWERDIDNNLTPNSSTDRQIINWNELLEAMDKEMKRLCWGVEDGRAYLQHKYHKKSRQALTDEEALEFYQFLTNRKSGYLVGDRVIVSHAAPSLNGQLAKVISVQPNHILEIEFATPLSSPLKGGKNQQFCEVSALHVTLATGGVL